MKGRWGTLLLVLGLFYLVITGNRGLWNLYRLHEEKQDLSEQIAQLKTEIDSCHYQEEFQTFDKNPSVFEKQAREELNLAKPGELVYKFAKTGP